MFIVMLLIHVPVMFGSMECASSDFLLRLFKPYLYSLFSYLSLIFSYSILLRRVALEQADFQGAEKNANYNIIYKGKAIN